MGKIRTIGGYPHCPCVDEHYPLGPLRVLRAIFHIMIGIIIGALIQIIFIPFVFP